jgi:hypothetical protein
VSHTIEMRTANTEAGLSAASYVSQSPTSGSYDPINNSYYFLITPATPFPTPPYWVQARGVLVTSGGTYYSPTQPLGLFDPSTPTPTPTATPTPTPTATPAPTATPTPTPTTPLYNLTTPSESIGGATGTGPGVDPVGPYILNTVVNVTIIPASGALGTMYFDDIEQGSTSYPDTGVYPITMTGDREAKVIWSPIPTPTPTPTPTATY